METSFLIHACFIYALKEVLDVMVKLLLSVANTNHICARLLQQQGNCLVTLSIFFISNFRRVLNVVCFLLGNSPVSEVYMPTFRNTLFHLHRQVGV